MGNRLLQGVILVISAVLFLALVSMDERWMILCPFHLVTGWDCPFCGGQRMIAALLRGEWLVAYNSNPLLFCALPLLILWGVRIVLPEYASRHPRIMLSSLFTIKLLPVYLVILLLWGIIRNIF